MLQVPGLRYGNPALPTIPHGAGQVRRLEVVELEPAWNAALEREGKAPGLSAYIGRSSVYHSPAWGDSLEKGECREIWRAARVPVSDAQRGHVRALLICGMSLRRAAMRAGVKLGTVRRIQDAMRAEKAARA